MRPNYHRLFFTALLAVFLSACKTVTIEQPAEGAVLSAAPTITLSFPKGAPDVLVVTLNGEDISSKFTVTDTGATATGSKINNFLVDGENLLKVVKPNTPLRKFFFDKSGPKVHVTSVTGNLTLSGYVEDPSGVASASANGKALSLGANNSFTVNIPNANFVDFVARDNLGYTRTERYARPNVSMAHALGMRINRDGLDFLESEIETLLVSDDFGDLVVAFNPITDDSILGNGYKIFANDATIDAASLALNVTGSNGNFGLSGSFHDIWADTSIQIDPLIGFNFTLNGAITLARADFGATAKIGAANGLLTVDVNVTSLNLDRIRTDINNFPDWLLTPFLEAFEWLFEIVLKGQIEAIAEEKIIDFVDTFPASLALEINGGSITPDIAPESVSSPSNGVNVNLSSHLFAASTHGPNQVGSRYIGTGALPTPTSTPPGKSEKDVGVVMSEDMINQALSAATKAGILNFTLSTADIPQLGGIDQSAGNARLRLVPTSAPAIDLISSNAEGLGTLEFNDFYMAIESKKAGQSNWDLLLGATLSILATADLGVTSANAIAIDVIGVPRIVIHDIDDNSALLLNEALTQSLINEFTPIALPIILSAVGAIPLPSFEGYSLNVGGLWVFDSAGHFAGVAADLVKSSSSSSAPIPRTFANLEDEAARSALATPIVEGEVVTIEASSDDVSGGEVSYRYSVDGRPFGLWKTNNQIKLYGQKAGEHAVTVCARSPQMVEDPECAVVEFSVVAAQ